MEGIRGILGVEDTKAPTSKTATSREVQKGTEGSTAKALQDSPRAGTPSTDQEDVSMGEDEDELDYAQFDDRLASSSGSESEDDDDDDDDTRPEKSTKAKYDPVKDLSLSPTPSIADSESPPATTVKSSKSRKDSKKTSTTTFLPSLTMGGYWSGTESEAEDDGVAAAAIEPRKNRMGQQARRKLWEKKFGQNANHVRKQADSNQRDSGWDMRRGATSQEHRGRDRGQGNRPAVQSRNRGAAPARDDRPERPRAPFKQQQEEKPMHPSWEAARKAKEKKTQASFQGKKVVFD